MSRRDQLLGATGRFPEGKITPDDEGELRFAVSQLSDGQIHIDFGKPVAWLTLPREVAIEFAMTLLKNAGATVTMVEEGSA